MKSGVSATFGEFLHGGPERCSGQPPRRPATDRRSRTDGRRRLRARTDREREHHRNESAGGRRCRPADRSMQPRAIGAPLASSARTRPRLATAELEGAAAHAARRGGPPRRPRLVDLRRGARRSAPLRPRRPARTLPALGPRVLDRRPARLAHVQPCPDAPTWPPICRSSDFENRLAVRERSATSRRGGGGCAPGLRRVRRARWCA